MSDRKVDTTGAFHGADPINFSDDSSLAEGVVIENVSPRQTQSSGLTAPGGRPQATSPFAMQRSPSHGQPESPRHVHFAEVPLADDHGHTHEQGGAHLSLPRRLSNLSLGSLTSANTAGESTITYFNSSNPRDPTAQLAVQFQESAEAVRARRAERTSELKLEPVKSLTDGILGARASIASWGSALRRQRKPRRDDAFVDREVRTDAHQVSITELEKRLGTNRETGLTHAEARARLLRDGPNQLTPPKGVAKWRLLARELLSPFALVLWGAAILCFVAFGVTITQGGNKVRGTNQYENLIVGIALVLVVVVTALFSFVQTVKSSNVMAGFAKLAPQTCVVVREGEMLSIPPAELVLGDVVCVEGGDNIPADLRVVAAHNMKVDNSALTGESDPQARSVACTNDNPLETANLAFSGTSVVEGSGRGIAIHTGDATVIGQLAGLVSGVEQEETPLTKEINRFVLYITLVAFALAIIFTGAGLGRGDYWPTLIVVVIGIVVGTVPEGLPSAVAVSLALAAKRMAAKNVLVTEQLAVVETLGRTTVIASDKTGTLTQNKMTVSHVWCDGAMIDARDDVLEGTSQLPKMLANQEQSSFPTLYMIGALCSRAVFEAETGSETSGETVANTVTSDSPASVKAKEAIQNEPVAVDIVGSETPVSLRKVIGDASETAILRFCEELRPVAPMRESHPKMAEIPFNSTNKYQVSVHAITGHPTADYVVVIKGAPERIMARCTSVHSHGEIHPLGDATRDAFDAAYAHMGSMGERVLGFCIRFLDRAAYPAGFEFTLDPVNIPMDNMVFVGLVSMMDPPRDSVASALATCRKAGIKVAMVTGDHPNTAQAIARKIGLLTPEMEALKRSVVIHGECLRDMTDAELDLALTHDEIVFARTSPAQKLRIVEGFQRADQIVAVTGDGVNDSPALKQANVGVAMGISGSDVSKDASDIILLDDNFGSIVNGVAEGRVIFDNLKKSIAYTLSSKFPQLIPYILSFFLRLPAPLNALLILSIDIGTDLMPAISLAYEKAEANVMKRPPRGTSHRDHLVNVPSVVYSYLFLGLIQCLAGFASYFTMYATGGGVQDGHFSFGQLWFDDGNDFVHSTEPMTDAEGVVWTQSQRLMLAKVASTAYFATLLHVRIWVLFTTKTLERSLFRHGLGGNRMLLGAAVSVFFIPFVISYVPGIEWVFNAGPLPWYAWFISLPFGMLLLALDELRKWAIRRYKGSALGDLLRY